MKNRDYDLEGWSICFRNEKARGKQENGDKTRG